MLANQVHDFVPATGLGYNLVTLFLEGLPRSRRLGPHPRLSRLLRPLAYLCPFSPLSHARGLWLSW